MPVLKGGHDAIDIMKVEKRTESHRPLNIHVDNEVMLHEVASSVYAKDRAGHVLLGVD